MSSEGQFDQFLPLAMAIAAIKVKLFESMLGEYIKRLEEARKRKLIPQEQGALQRAIKELVASLPPAIFKIEPNWNPTSEEAVRAKMSKLKNDPEFQIALKKLLVEQMPKEQMEIGG